MQSKSNYLRANSLKVSHPITDGMPARCFLLDKPFRHIIPADMTHPVIGTWSDGQPATAIDQCNSIAAVKFRPQMQHPSD